MSTVQFLSVQPKVTVTFQISRIPQLHMSDFTKIFTDFKKFNLKNTIANVSIAIVQTGIWLNNTFYFAVKCMSNDFYITTI